MLKEAKKKVGKGKIVLYKYEEQQWALSRDIAGEMIHLYPNKIVIIGREKSGKVKCSIRSRSVNLRPIIAKALQGIEGYGGGHEYACGSVIKVEDFEQYIKNIKRELK
jgi:nanoRNase/pAp phosphatase (c-di-AMP/oligoRNAs hydrolase)